jgi:hypothetical protein
VGKLSFGSNAELSIATGEMALDRLWAHEQHRGDLAGGRSGYGAVESPPVELDRLRMASDEALTSISI